MDLLRERGWRLVATVDTHIHADHLSRSKVLATQAGAELLLPAQGRIRYPFHALNEGDRIQFGAAELVALHTPGHTAESTTYSLADAAAFTGDTVFLAGVGRPDLEGGAAEDVASRARLLYRSIQRLLRLPAATLIVPAHVSEPIPFDGRLLATSVEAVRENIGLARLAEEQFVQSVVERIPSAPPNHARVVELNELGERPTDPTELEAGANRCAIA